jgi:LmbE family N-acetylglucosaminyl deacetylase
MRRQRAASVQPPHLLGVFAHPDDEVFCMGGTLAQWAEAGGETMIVSATRGEAGQIQDARVASRGTLGAVREQELRAACTQLGVRRVECLDYGDGALAEVDEATLAGHVATFIRDFQPDVVVTFGLDGGYGHPDHIAISEATTRACQLVAREDGWAPQLYYSAFPQQHGSLCYQLAHWLTTRGEPFRGSAEFVRALALLADEAALLGHTDDAVETQWFPAGFSIVEQGERRNSLYLIISGHATVIHEDARGARHLRRRLGPGEFFGAEALALHYRHGASVVALDTVTCLVLSSQAPTAFAGRGKDALLGGLDGGAAAASADDGEAQDELIHMDISAYLDHKAAALAAHRTQFAVEPEMLPLAHVWQLLGREYFEPVSLATSTGAQYAIGPDGALWLDAQPLLALPA